MKNTILFLIIFVITFGCKEANVTADNIEALISFGIVDQNGDDLIAQGLINEDDITVYFKNESGEYKIYYEANLDDPKGVHIYENIKDVFGFHVMGFYPNERETNTTSSHIIDWGIEGFEQDTFDCKFENKPGSLILTEVNLNGKDFWKRGDDIQETLKVVKHRE